MIRVIALSLFVTLFSSSVIAAESSSRLRLQADAEGYYQQIQAVQPETGAVMRVKPLDDPQNPYREFYTELDYWTLEHFNPAINIKNYQDWSVEHAFGQTRNHLPDDWRVISMVVDHNGYMLPYSVYQLESLHHRTLQESIWPDKQSAHPYMFYGAGQMSSEVGSIKDWAEDVALAAYTPTVPDWLIELKPERAAILPDGRYIVQGTRPYTRPNGEEIQLVEYYLHDSAGNRLDPPQHNIGSEWQGMLWNYYDHLATVNQDGRRYMRLGPYEAVLTPDNSEIIRLVDYAGQPVEPDPNLVIERHYGKLTDLRRLERWHAAQQRVGDAAAQYRERAEALWASGE